MLGKPTSDPCLEQFMGDLGEKGKLLSDSKSMSDYFFPDSGLDFHIDKRQDQIKSIFFHLSTAMVEAGNMASYKGSLPAGITVNDDRFSIRKKLNQKPKLKRIQGRTKNDPKDYWEDYFIGDLKLTFIFDGESGRMDALSIHYLVDNLPPEPPPPEPEEYIKSSCTKAALKTIMSAKDEARKLQHRLVGSEFLLLSLFSDHQSIPFAVLNSAGATEAKTRKEVRKIVGVGEHHSIRKVRYTPGAKRLLEGALSEAKKSGCELMGTEHILLGIIEVGEGVAFRVLQNLKVDTEKLRNEVLRQASSGKK
jgi:hypothetical protein